MPKDRESTASFALNRFSAAPGRVANLGGPLALAVLAVAVFALPGARLSLPDLPAPPILPWTAGAGEAVRAYADLPLTFVANAGQLDDPAKYYARGRDFGFYFGPSEARFSFVKEGRGAALALRFVGASASARLEPTRRLPGKVNYLIGDPTRWRTGLASYAELVYHDLWAGIDLAVRGQGGRLKYEFRLAPGARIRDMSLAYGGAERLSLSAAGDLLVATPVGVLSDSRPSSYQLVRGRRVPVESRYVLHGRSGYGFAVGRYDPASPLVIDPGLAYSTFLGGTGNEQGLRVVVDGEGNAYVGGWTFSPEYPTTPGAFDETHNGNTDAVVSKLNPAGSALVYSTFVGGVDEDFLLSLAIGGGGDAYLTGSTASSDFPTTAGAFDRSYNGAKDAFAARLDASGSTLVYSTFLGGAEFDRGWGLATDEAGNAYVVGQTHSPDFPTTAGAYDRVLDGPADAFVTKLSATGSKLAYSTLLGGTSELGELAGDVTVRRGSAYVSGATFSADFPTTVGAFDETYNGNRDAFVTRVNKPGSDLVYSTFLGGSGHDSGITITLDRNQNAYAAGRAGENFPTTPGAFDETHNGDNDAFVAKLDARGSSLVYSTYLGGQGVDEAYDIVVNRRGSAHVTGFTNSPEFPTSGNAFDPTFNGIWDAFVTKLSSAGSSLPYSTFLGGTLTEFGFGLAVKSGHAYVTGRTDSADFPITPGAFDTSHNGSLDTFVTKLDLSP